MTVSYSSKVATTKYFTFLRLLFLWKGSVYRLVWFELLAFISLYAIISITYRFLLTELLRTYFEWVCLYCRQLSETIPVAFVLGFYVSLVVSRWWDQFISLPWPDQLALYLTAYCHGSGERPTRIRRTVMRYVNLGYCLALRAISSRARLRFPTEGHLVTAGLITKEELDVYLVTQPVEYPLYFIPFMWSLDIITKARQEGYIRYDRAVEILSEEIANFRGKLGIIFAYDWINPPLVYTQTATIAVYTYFASCLMAWQYLDPSKQLDGSEMDLYVPLFGILRFFFYMGWLKVAESLINPFGEDVDDFEIEYMIERNLQVSYLIVDEMHHDHPELVRDAYWEAGDGGTPPWSKSAHFIAGGGGGGGSFGAHDPMGGDEGTAGSPTSEWGPPGRFAGSLANLNVTDQRPSFAFWRSGSLLRRKISAASPSRR